VAGARGHLLRFHPGAKPRGHGRVAKIIWTLREQ
jgi:hypothetical protein